MILNDIFNTEVRVYCCGFSNTLVLSILKFYLHVGSIVQNFDNLSSLLKNPQIIGLLQQLMNAQNSSITNDFNNKNASNNANSMVNESNNLQNMQMIANMMSILNNNSNPFMAMGNNNPQNMMMLMNLMSQMQNNSNNNQNKIVEKNQDDENS